MVFIKRGILKKKKKTGNVRINITLRHLSETNVAVGKQ